MLRVIIMCAVTLSLCVACGGGDEGGAKKKDKADQTKEEPKEEPAEEAPAEEEPAEEAMDMSAYDEAATVTADDTGGMKFTQIDAEKGFAACGIEDADIVKKVNGSDLATGKDGIESIKMACAKGEPISVMRGEEMVDLNAGE